MGFIPMQIALAQTNSTVGDLCGNAKRILAFARRAADGGANVVVFPELSLTGYPPRDLLEKESFLDRTEQHLERLAADAAPLNISIICGTVTRTGSPAGLPIYNSAAVLQGGRITFRQHKMLLPTYDVFDEARYFQPAEQQSPGVSASPQVPVFEREPPAHSARQQRQALRERPRISPPARLSCRCSTRARRFPRGSYGDDS